MPSLRGGSFALSKLSPLDLTPIGIVTLLLSPPIVYLWIALIAFCACTAFIRMIWDTIEPYVYMVLDFIAMIVRGIVTTARCIFWTIQRCFYPLKEWIFGSFDSIDRWLHPYKRKKPYSNVPFFQF
eukprot:TRINITY_DN57055_c0_g1_i1.p1 TRINITY_DN57055_c0_g1~~TRINITY_DN57055_c0_g1_i1.p1  ORF type:complete len:126 (+),score=3.72 TRINITY_DN57055_c0_g1_i1:225-602(+)